MNSYLLVCSVWVYLHKKVWQCVVVCVGVSVQTLRAFLKAGGKGWGEGAGVIPFKTAPPTPVPCLVTPLYSQFPALKRKRPAWEDRLQLQLEGVTGRPNSFNGLTSKLFEIMHITIHGLWWNFGSVYLKLNETKKMKKEKCGNAFIAGFPSERKGTDSKRKIGQLFCKK